MYIDALTWEVLLSLRLTMKLNSLLLLLLSPFYYG